MKQSFNEIRLMQMQAVERIVRPVRAGPARKRKMREELLAHLTVIYEEEQARLNDPAAAVPAAARRLGPPAELTRELNASLPFLERQAYRFDRCFGWRPPESAARFMARFAVQLFLLIAALSCLDAAVYVGRWGWDRAVLFTVQPILTMAVGSPTLFLLGLLYFKMRDSIWGAFGSRQSTPLAALLCIPFAGLITIGGVAYMAISTSDWNLALESISPWLGLGILTAGECFLLAWFYGRTEIADAVWACLDIEPSDPQVAGD